MPVSDKSFDARRFVTEVAVLDCRGEGALELLFALVVPSGEKCFVVTERGLSSELETPGERDGVPETRGDSLPANYAG
jgi:hypothetical protein